MDAQKVHSILFWNFEINSSLATHCFTTQFVVVTSWHHHSPHSFMCSWATNLIVLSCRYQEQINHQHGTRGASRLALCTHFACVLVHFAGFARVCQRFRLQLRWWCSVHDLFLSCHTDMYVPEQNRRDHLRSFLVDGSHGVISMFSPWGAPVVSPPCHCSVRDCVPQTRVLQIIPASPTQSCWWMPCCGP